jgi:predicted HTH transcriptional regulator
MVELETGEKGRVTEVVSSSAAPAQTLSLPTDDSKFTPAPNDVEELLNAGEGPNIEFKASAFWSEYRDLQDFKRSPEVNRYGKSASSYIIAKTVSALLNSQGGNLVIGLQESKEEEKPDEVVGIESEFHVSKDKNLDGYRRKLVHKLSGFLPKIAPTFNHFVHLSFPEHDGETLCVISVRPCDQAVFVSAANEEHFYVRRDAETIELKGSELTAYTAHRFKS